MDKWKQFVANKQRFIGGILEDHGDDVDRGIYSWFHHIDMPGNQTTIKDIRLRENGSSWFFEIIGEAFTCGFDIRHGQLMLGKHEWTTFQGFSGHVFCIKPFDPPFKVGQYVTYNNGHTVERGRVKTLHPERNDAVWVVYKCGDNWDFFMNYTGQLTEIKYLKLGWKEATIDKP